VTVDSVFIGAKACLNGQIVECSIAVDEGKIQKIGREPQMPNADEKTNLHGLLVLPGLIDEHVHLRDEGKAYKEDFSSGTAAAAAGGFTTIMDMPNNEPVTSSALTLKNRMEIAERKILVNVGFYSEFPKKTSSIPDILEQDAVGFKLFMGSQVGGLNIDDDEDLQEAFKEAADQNAIVAVHAEDKALLLANEQKLKQAKRLDLAAFQEAHSETVEVKAIERLLKVSEPTSVHLHFCHVSTAAGLKAIADAKKTGRKVTVEVTPNHLLLSTDDLTHYGQLVVMAPPLRSQSNVEALWKGLGTGTVDTMGSDHAPHTAGEKSASSVWEVKVGVPCLETTLPMFMTLVRKNELLMSQVVKLLAEKPAEIWGLSDRASLEQGKNADLTIVNFRERFKIDASKFKSKAKFSPYDGWEVNGRVVKTYVGGLLVFEGGEIVAKPGSGQIVRRGSA
jgi:dihydroorotase (multifunctional complex type)